MKPRWEDAVKRRMVSAGLVLIFFTPVALAASEIDPAKETDIRRLIELTGGNKIGLALGQQMAEQFKQLTERMVPQNERSRQILEVFGQKLRKKAEAAEFTELLIPIYDEHLTRGEIQGLIEFYQSPLGQKVIEALPQIMQRSYQVGAEWGQQLSQEILQEMQEEFPELAPPSN